MIVTENNDRDTRRRASGRAYIYILHTNSPAHIIFLFQVLVTQRGGSLAVRSSTYDTCIRIEYHRQLQMRGKRTTIRQREKMMGNQP